jgi:elongation factor Ts
MTLLYRRCLLTTQRCFHTSTIRCSTAKPSLASMVSKLRRTTQAPISKAREAAEKYPDDYEAALAYLNETLAQLGQEKASKLAGREARQGLVAMVAGPGARGVVIELLCETDFVAKNALIRQLTQRAALTAMLTGNEGTTFTPYSRHLDQTTLLNAPLLESTESKSTQTNLQTVQEGILDAISKLGEKITLGRTLLMEGQDYNADTYTLHQVAGYIHGGEDTFTGRIAGLVLTEAQASHPLTTEDILKLQQTLQPLSRDLARQIVGFSPSKINPIDETDTSALLAQPWLRNSEWNVSQALIQFKQQHQLQQVRVLDFIRIEVGEQI